MVKLHHRHHHGQGYLHFAAAVLGLALLWDLASDLSLRLEEVVNVAVVACPLYCVISRVAAPMLAGTAELRVYSLLFGVGPFLLWYLTPIELNDCYLAAFCLAPLLSLLRLLVRTLLLLADGRLPGLTATFPVLRHSPVELAMLAGFVLLPVLLAAVLPLDFDEAVGFGFVMLAPLA